MDIRVAKSERKTKETDIKLTLNIDGTGEIKCNTGVGFFDHMLAGFARHGLFDITLDCAGDTNVDCHHTIEDVGIVLGDAFRKALGDKASINRYGSALIPMDDALVMCAADLSGRPFLVHECEYTVEKLGELDTEVINEFFYAFTYSAGVNLHVRKISGTNNHHVCEASFKAAAKSLAQAARIDRRAPEVWSTKGTL